MLVDEIESGQRVDDAKTAVYEDVASRLTLQPINVFLVDGGQNSSEERVVAALADATARACATSCSARAGRHCATQFSTMTSQIAWPVARLPAFVGWRPSLVYSG